MRSFLLFIGGILHHVVMVIISPLLLFVYLLLATVVLSRFVRNKTEMLLSYVAKHPLPLLHFHPRKQLVFRAKAVRLHS